MNPSITIEECESKWSDEISDFCKVFVGDKDDGWIISLGIFQSLKKKLPDLNGTHNIRCFLYQTALQRCINFIRRKNIMNGNETETLERQEGQI